MATMAKQTNQKKQKKQTQPTGTRHWGVEGAPIIKVSTPPKTKVGRTRSRKGKRRSLPTLYGSNLIQKKPIKVISGGLPGLGKGGN
jgi:hypothetical protein